MKSAMVLAVEALEGTDAALRRGGALGRGAAVAVKVSKPGQDLRFDVPAVGPADGGRLPGRRHLRSRAGSREDAAARARDLPGRGRAADLAVVGVRVDVAMNACAPRWSASATWAAFTPRSTPALDRCRAGRRGRHRRASGRREVGATAEHARLHRLSRAARQGRLRQSRRSDAASLRPRRGPARARHRRAGREADDRDGGRGARRWSRWRTRAGAFCRSDTWSASIRPSGRWRASSRGRASSSAIAWRRSSSAAPRSTSFSI